MGIFWDCLAWLLSPEYRQAGRDIEREFERFDILCQQGRELEKRAMASFTPEEWEETRVGDGMLHVLIPAVSLHVPFSLYVFAAF